jgi:hypothetical protein
MNATKFCPSATIPLVLQSERCSLCANGLRDCRQPDSGCSKGSSSLLPARAHNPEVAEVVQIREAYIQDSVRRHCFTIWIDSSKRLGWSNWHHAYAIPTRPERGRVESLWITKPRRPPGNEPLIEGGHASLGNHCKDPLPPEIAQSKGGNDCQSEANRPNPLLRPTMTPIDAHRLW